MMAERIDESTRSTGTPLGREETTGSATGETAAIRAEIRETRERMGETVEEIGERLNPNRLKEQVKQNVRDATIGKVENMARDVAGRMDDTRRTAMDAVRDNPVPAAMIGIGVGWLLWNARHESSGGDARYGGRTETGRDGYSGGYAGGAAYGTGVARTGATRTDESYGEDEPGTMERMKDRAGEVGERAQEMAGEVAEQTRHRLHRAEDQFFENPLAVGAVTLALGVAAGLAVPRTRKESELMGGARDKLVDRVKDAARDAKDKVQHVAERTMDEAQSTAKETARQEGLTS